MKQRAWKPKFKKLVKDAIKDYVRELGFRHYDVYTRWFDDNTDAEDPRDSVLAACTVDRRYLQATVKIYPALEDKWLRDKDDNEVRRAVAHEIAHIATAHLWHIAMCVYKDSGEAHDAWESLTTVVGRLLYDLEKKP